MFKCTNDSYKNEYPDYYYTFTDVNQGTDASLLSGCNNNKIVWSNKSLPCNVFLHTSYYSVCIQFNELDDSNELIGIDRCEWNKVVDSYSCVLRGYYNNLYTSEAIELGDYSNFNHFTGCNTIALGHNCGRNTFKNCDNIYFRTSDQTTLKDDTKIATGPILDGVANVQASNCSRVLLWSTKYIRNLNICDVISNEWYHEDYYINPISIQIDSCGYHYPLYVSRNSQNQIRVYCQADLIAPTLINFTINGVVYRAETNMTWKNWTNSSYNTGGYFNDSDDYIKQSNQVGNVCYENNPIDPYSVIRSQDYSFVVGGMGAGGEDSWG